MQEFCGERQTQGLSNPFLKKFLDLDPQLKEAIEAAGKEFDRLAAMPEYAEVLQLSEKDQIDALQAGYVNFYAEDAVNPYVAIAARGPWVVTTCGAVVHDSGGYGMLGGGHSPEGVVRTMGEHYPMANIMTAHFAQKRMYDLLLKEIGHTRPEAHRTTYTKFLCMNSGSESVTVAARLTDTNAKTLTDPGGKHEGKKIMFLAFEGGFHGRTDRPAQVSDSSNRKYSNALASFRDRKNLVTIPPNSIKDLEEAFEWADEEGVFFEALFMEPVMGEGDPGKALDPGFYKKARALTKANGTLLLIDSIQAGIRAHGCLSLVDYPGFETLDPPDMETFSKALNAGQYPFSVLAMTKETADLYLRGTYGNTMTTNPRSLQVACEVLESLTPELRANIQRQGKHFVDKLNALKDKMPDSITKVQGTGLLFSAELNGSKYKVLGFDGIETRLRKMGIGVIHGGENSLRFTPIFAITDAEVDMILEHVEKVLVEFDG